MPSSWHILWENHFSIYLRVNTSQWKRGDGQQKFSSGSWKSDTWWVYSQCNTALAQTLRRTLIYIFIIPSKGEPSRTSSKSAALLIMVLVSQHQSAQLVSGARSRVIYYEDQSLRSAVFVPRPSLGKLPAGFRSIQISKAFNHTKKARSCTWKSHGRWLTGCQVLFSPSAYCITAAFKILSWQEKDLMMWKQNSGF